MESIDPVNIIFTATGGRFRPGGGYLSCDNCKGYYELQIGESPEDFCEICECGGYLTFTPLIERYISTDNQDMNHSMEYINHSADDFSSSMGYIGHPTDNLNPELKSEELDQLEMEKETDEVIETYKKESRIPRQLPMGPVLIGIFFVILIIVFGIFSMVLGFDNLIVLTDF